MLHISFVAPPEALRIVGMNSTSITVTWEVTCDYCPGGVVSGYLVRHWDQNEDNVVTVSRTYAVNQHTLHGLKPSTKYSIEVATVYNTVNGAYSSPITGETAGKLA